jgi:hypothetical protein
MTNALTPEEAHAWTLLQAQLEPDVVDRPLEAFVRRQALRRGYLLRRNRDRRNRGLRQWVLVDDGPVNRNNSKVSKAMFARGYGHTLAEISDSLWEMALRDVAHALDLKLGKGKESWFLYSPNTPVDLIRCADLGEVSEYLQGRRWSISFDDPNLTPAGGVAEFSVRPHAHDIEIDGPDRWQRPVNFLLGDEPVVLAEDWEFLTATNYLNRILTPELRKRHGLYRYLPHVDGPIGDAPRIRRAEA